MLLSLVINNQFIIANNLFLSDVYRSSYTYTLITRFGVDDSLNVSFEVTRIVISVSFIWALDPWLFNLRFLCLLFLCIYFAHLKQLNLPWGKDHQMIILSSCSFIKLSKMSLISKRWLIKWWAKLTFCNWLIVWF